MSSRGDGAGPRSVPGSSLGMFSASAMQALDNDQVRKTPHGALFLASELLVQIVDTLSDLIHQHFRDFEPFPPPSTHGWLPQDVSSHAGRLVPPLLNALVQGCTEHAGSFSRVADLERELADHRKVCGVLRSQLSAANDSFGVTTADLAALRSANDTQVRVLEREAELLINHSRSLSEQLDQVTRSAAADAAAAEKREADLKASAAKRESELEGELYRLKDMYTTTEQGYSAAMRRAEDLAHECEEHSREGKSIKQRLESAIVAAEERIKQLSARVEELEDKEGGVLAAKDAKIAELEQAVEYERELVKRIRTTSQAQIDKLQEEADRILDGGIDDMMSSVMDKNALKKRQGDGLKVSTKPFVFPWTRVNRNAYVTARKDPITATKSLQLRRPELYWLCHTCNRYTSDEVEVHYEGSHKGLDASAVEAAEGRRVATAADGRGRRDRTEHPSAERIVELALAFAEERLHMYPREVTVPIYTYTMETEVYADMNKALRESSEARIHPWLAYAHALDEAVSRLDRHSGFVYRGLGVEVSYEVDSIVCWPAFSSATMSARVVTDFLGAAGSGTLFVIASESARPIRHFSALPHENEVLFPPNTFFRVMSYMPPGIKRLLSSVLRKNLMNVAVYEFMEVQLQTYGHVLLALRPDEMDLNRALVSLIENGTGVAEDADGVSESVPAKDASHGVRDADGNSPLHLAVSLGGNRGVVQILLHMMSAVADLHAKNAAGQSPLLVAASVEGNKRIVELLMEEGADVAAVDTDGHSALHCAVAHGRLDTAMYLLQTRRFDVNLQANDGSTPLILAAKEKGSRQLIRALLEAGANPSAVTRDGYSAIWYAARQRPCAQAAADVIDALVRYMPSNSTNVPAAITAADRHGVTALHNAVSGSGNLDVVKKMVAPTQRMAGANVMAQTLDKENVLHAACGAIDRGVCDLSTLRYLIDLGVPVDSQDVRGQTPLYYLTLYGSSVAEQGSCQHENDDIRPDAPTSPHGSAVAESMALLSPVRASKNERRLKEVAAMAELLLKNGARVDHVSLTTGSTPLLNAARSGAAAPVMAVLLEAGADFSAVDKDGRTILHLLLGGTEIPVQALDHIASKVQSLDRDHPSFIDVNAVEQQNGRTAMHLACQHKNALAAVNILLRMGAHPEAGYGAGGVDRSGVSPLEYAARVPRNADVISALVDAGFAPPSSSHPLHVAAAAAVGQVAVGRRAQAAQLLQPHHSVAPDDPLALDNDPVSPSAVADAHNVVQLFAALGFDVNAADNSGESAIVAAVRAKADISMVRALLDFGASPDAVTTQGWRALHVAVTHPNNAATIRVLLTAGARVDGRSERGSTLGSAYIADRACRFRAVAERTAQIPAGATPLMVAAACVKNDHNMKTLAAAGANGMAVDEWGRNVLHYAASRPRNYDNVAWLLEALGQGGALTGAVQPGEVVLASALTCPKDGSKQALPARSEGEADRPERLVSTLLRQRSADGVTPLTSAILCGATADVVTSLIGAGADPTSVIWTPQASGAATEELSSLAGATALHVTVLLRNVQIPKIVDALLEGGAQALAKDSNGHTALDLLREELARAVELQEKAEAAEDDAATAVAKQLVAALDATASALRSAAPEETDARLRARAEEEVRTQIDNTVGSVCSGFSAAVTAVSAFRLAAARLPQEVIVCARLRPLTSEEGSNASAKSAVGDEFFIPLHEACNGADDPSLDPRLHRTHDMQSGFDVLAVDIDAAAAAGLDVAAATHARNVTRPRTSAGHPLTASNLGRRGSVQLPAGPSNSKGLSLTNAAHAARKHTQYELRFPLDMVFAGEGGTQSMVYTCIGQQTIGQLVRGRDVVWTVTGSRGSGRNYTLLGTPQAPGTLSRVLARVYELMAADPLPLQLLLTALEVAPDGVHDALQPVSEWSPNGLRMQYRPEDCSYEVPAKAWPCRTPRDARDALERVSALRASSDYAARGTAGLCPTVYRFCIATASGGVESTPLPVATLHVIVLTTSPCESQTAVGRGVTRTPARGSTVAATSEGRPDRRLGLGHSALVRCLAHREANSGVSSLTSHSGQYLHWREHALTQLMAAPLQKAGKVFVVGCVAQLDPSTVTKASFHASLRPW